jgi:hypothetical protein
MKKEKIKSASIEGIMLKKGNEGDYFYTDKQDKSMTAFATYYKRKIKTERVIAITGYKQEPKALTLTKVTIL